MLDVDEHCGWATVSRLSWSVIEISSKLVRIIMALKCFFQGINVVPDNLLSKSPVNFSANDQIEYLANLIFTVCGLNWSNGVQKCLTLAKSLCNGYLDRNTNNRRQTKHNRVKRGGKPTHPRRSSDERAGWIFWTAQFDVHIVSWLVYITVTQSCRCPEIELQRHRSKRRISVDEFA